MEFPSWIFINGGARAPQSGVKFGGTRKRPGKILQGDAKSSLCNRRLPFGVPTIVTPNRCPHLPLKIFRGKKQVPCAPKGLSNYLRQIYAVLTFSDKDWMPRTKFGVSVVDLHKRGRYGPPKLGQIFGKMKTAVKHARGLPKILSPGL